MQNAHEPFESLEYTNRTKDTITRVRVNVDRAMRREAEPDTKQPEFNLSHLIPPIFNSRRPIWWRGGAPCFPAHCSESSNMEDQQWKSRMKYRPSIFPCPCA